MTMRKEKDSLGNVFVPSDAMWGAQTQRAIQNFPISGYPLPLVLFYSYVRVKRAAAAANISTGRLDVKKGNAILNACDGALAGRFDNQFVVDAFQAGAGTSTNMNVNEVLANQATKLLGGSKGQYLVHPNDHVNMAQSTNDTFHTAMHVAAVQEMTALLESCNILLKALNKKSAEFSKIVKSGKTHLMDAVPLTLGQEFSGYSAAIEKDVARIEKSIDALLEVNIGGTAVGTGMNAEPKYIKEVVGELSKITKQKFRSPKNFFEATQNISAVLEASAAMRALAVDLVKISNDLRLMQMINEISLPAVQPGSSIMPGKVNPSIAEMTAMVGYQVIGNDTVIVNAATSAQLELNVMMPVACKNLLESSKILTNATKVLAEKCISGIVANDEVIKHNLEGNMALVTALSPYIGYEKAAEAAKKAAAQRKTLRQVILEMNLMHPNEVDKVLNALELTKPGVPKKK